MDIWDQRDQDIYAIRWRFDKNVLSSIQIGAVKQNLFENFEKKSI